MTAPGVLQELAVDLVDDPRSAVALVAAEKGDCPAGALLDRVRAFLSRFIAYPSEHALHAHVLWIAHAHLMAAWESTPRIAFLSPEPGSGKSRALEVTELLVPRPLHAVNASPAALFRKVSDEDGAPTILFDEIDTVFGPRAKDNEDIRGMLNAGHRRGATALRCVIRGKAVETVEFPAYCAVALAGLDDLPDTIATRSVIIRMRRRAPHEVVEPFRHRLNAPDGHKIADALAGWAAIIEPTVSEAWPTMPEGIEDRNADVWEALLAVADAAGGEWPDAARRSAVALVAAAKTDGGSLGVRLLSDVRAAFTESASDRLSTEDLLHFLTDLEDAPWADLRGKPLDSRSLSRRLGKYEISPKNMRINDRVVKGYEYGDLLDAFSRYLVTTPGNKEGLIANGEIDARCSNDVGGAHPELPLPTAHPQAEDAATSATPLRAPTPQEPAGPAELVEPADPALTCLRCRGLRTALNPHRRCQAHTKPERQSA